MCESRTSVPAGQVPQGWEVRRLEQMIEVLDHMRVPISAEERFKRQGTVPYYGANGHQGWIDDYLFDEPLVLIAEDGGNFDDFASRPIAYKISGKSWVNNHAHILRAKNGNKLDFIFFTLAHKDIRRYIAGSTRSKLTQRELKSIEVLTPLSPAEQSRIAAVLDTVDEAIAKTEAVIAKLKEVRAGLLHDLLTRGLDEHGQLRDPVAHLEQFQDSPLGRIPREWRFCRLGDVLQTQPRNGYSPQEAPAFRNGYILGLGCLTSDGFAPVQLKNAPMDAGLDRFLLHDGDLLISRSNTRELVALPGIFSDVGYPCYYPDLMMRLVPKPELSAEFLELILRYSVSRTWLVASATGTSGTMVKITGAGVMQIPVAFPPRNESHEQQRMLAVRNAVNDEVRALLQELTKLKSLKSGLMDDLLTGRVRVPESITDGGRHT